MSDPIRPTKKLVREGSERVGFWFPPDSPIPDGDYLMRGGICWPETTADGIEGCAIMCGRHEKSGQVFVFEEKPFVCVDHIIAPDGNIEFSGIAPWFTEMWAAWFARTYYWHQDRFAHKRHLVDILRSPMANPKPVIAEVEWADDRAALDRVFLLDTHGHLIYRRDGMIHSAIQIYEATKSEGKPDVRPALHAAACAVMGLARYSKESR